MATASARDECWWSHPDNLQFSPNWMLLACLDAATIKVMAEHFKVCGFQSW